MNTDTDTDTAVQRPAAAEPSYINKAHRLLRMASQVVKARRWQTAPLEIGWDCTYRCNARCAYCSNWTTDYPVMPLEKAKVLVTRTRNLGAVQMSLSGGEPMTRKDLPEIIGLIKAEGMRAAFTTNGTVVSRERYRAVMEAGVDSITFSIDGADAATHEQFREGCSFDSLLRAINMCLELKKEFGYRTRISTNTVLTNRNVGDVLRIAERVRSLGIDDFHFQPVWKQHFVPEHLKHSVLDNFNDVFGFTKGNRALLEEAARLIELARSSNDPAYTALFADFYLGTERAKAIECWAGRAFLFIDADGNVRPCGSVPDTFGNILAPDFESTFEERFESHRARELKRQLAKQSCGGCASVCYMERNILMETTRDPVKLVGVVRKRLLR